MPNQAVPLVKEWALALKSIDTGLGLLQLNNIPYANAIGGVLTGLGDYYDNVRWYIDALETDRLMDFVYDLRATNKLDKMIPGYLVTGTFALPNGLSRSRDGEKHPLVVSSVDAKNTLVQLFVDPPDAVAKGKARWAKRNVTWLGVNKVGVTPEVEFGLKLRWLPSNLKIGLRIGDPQGAFFEYDVRWSSLECR